MGSTPCIENRSKEKQEFEESKEKPKKRERSDPKLGYLRQTISSSENLFYFGHYSKKCISVGLSFVNYQMKKIICCNSVQIDPGFSGSVLLSSFISKMLDLEEEREFSEFTMADGSKKQYYFNGKRLFGKKLLY